MRLGAHLAWLRGSGFSLTKIKRLLAEATHEEKEFCACSATVAAGATGTIGKTQIAMLEAICDTLGVPRGSLCGGMHAGLGAATVAADGPVDVAEAVPEILHPVPGPPAAEPAAHAEDKLASVRADTERVSALLADVFKEATRFTCSWATRAASSCSPYYIGSTRRPGWPQSEWDFPPPWPTSRPPAFSKAAGPLPCGRPIVRSKQSPN